MSFVEELRKVRQEYLDKLEADRIVAETENRNKAKVWVDEVLQPYLIKNAHLGKVKLEHPAEMYYELKDPYFLWTKNLIDKFLVKPYHHIIQFSQKSQ